jgi:aldose 1-epimerase
MTRTVVTSGLLDDEPTVALQHGASLLVVALRGATILRWVVDLGDGLVDLLDGYRDADELRSQDGIRNGIMAPFCDRVAGAAYVFDGQEHDLLPGSTARLVYHGLVRSMPFTLDLLDTDDGLAATFRCHGLSEVPHPGYPFPVDVDVTYRLGPASLGVQIDGHNRGTVPAPFASGWHPYFRLPGATTVDELELRVASRTRIETDAALIPLPGQDAYAAIGPDQAQWQPIGDAVLDVGYLADGPAILRSPSSGVERRRADAHTGLRSGPRVHRRHDRARPSSSGRRRTGRVVDGRVQPPRLRGSHPSGTGRPSDVRCHGDGDPHSVGRFRRLTVDARPGARTGADDDSAICVLRAPWRPAPRPGPR